MNDQIGPTKEDRELLAAVRLLRRRIGERIDLYVLDALSFSDLCEVDYRLAMVEQAAGAAAAFGEEIPFGGSADNEVPEPAELAASAEADDGADEQQDS